MGCLSFFNLPADAETLPPEMRGSGQPLPRFVSIGTDKAFVRTGPANRYPIKWVYKKEGLPVEIIQEFDIWRKIRDVDGSEGWISKALLSDRRMVVVKSQSAVDLRDRQGDESRTIARVEPGVIAQVKACGMEWCNITSGGFSGWVERKSLWGIYPQEEIN